MDDFNFDSLDLGRTWTPPNYIATAPPIVCRDKNQSQRRYDTEEESLDVVSHTAERIQPGHDNKGQYCPSHKMPDAFSG